MNIDTLHEEFVLMNQDIIKLTNIFDNDIKELKGRINELEETVIELQKTVKNLPEDMDTKI